MRKLLDKEIYTDEDRKTARQLADRNHYSRNTDKERAKNRLRSKTPSIRYSNLKSSSKRRGLDVTLSLDEHAAFLLLPCYYCGKPLQESGSGLDRQDNRMGYVHGNVVSCCRKCNWRKGALEGAGLRYPRTIEVLLEIITSDAK